MQETAHINIRRLCMPSSKGALKKLGTKRRRIRNRFGGEEFIDQLAVTLDVLPPNLIGIKVTASSKNGHKAFVASESYVKETNIDLSKSAFCHTLIYLLRLMMNKHKVRVFYSKRLKNPKENSSPILKALLTEFEDLEFHETKGGWNLEQMERKLFDLKHDFTTNEIVNSVISQELIEAFADLPVNRAEADLTQKTIIEEPDHNTDRGALLKALKWFMTQLHNKDYIEQVALVGSICTDKKNPKDLDILVAVNDKANFKELSSLRRRTQGRVQRGLLGVDLFIARAGKYIGRGCRYKEPWLRVVCSHDNLCCSQEDPFLCNTSKSFSLKDELVANPPIIIYPEVSAKGKVPGDVAQALGIS